jgi:protein-S-isoprenylcysteine O-methyltransferase Ste14
MADRRVKSSQASSASASRLPWFKLARIVGGGSAVLLVIFTLGLEGSEGQSGPSVWLSVIALVVFATVAARLYIAVRRAGASVARAVTMPFCRSRQFGASLVGS